MIFEEKLKRDFPTHTDWYWVKTEELENMCHGCNLKIRGWT